MTVIMDRHLSMVSVDSILRLFRVYFQEKYKVDIELIRPRIAFKETIRKKVDTEYKYKKQSGGHGQYGHVKIIMEPSGDMDTPYVFEQTVVGGAVPKNYFPAVEKGMLKRLRQALLQSILLQALRLISMTEAIIR